MNKTFHEYLRVFWLDNVCLQAKSNLPHVFVNKVLLGHSHIHSFAHGPWLLLDNNAESSSATKTIWPAKLKTFNIWCFNKSLLTPGLVFKGKILSISQ